MLSYNICIAIIFTESAVKHGFTERAAISVITNAMFTKTSFDTSRVPGGCAASICRTGSVWPDYRGHGFTGGPMHIGDLSCHAVAAETSSAYGPGGMTMTDNLDGRLAAWGESDASISAPGQTCHGLDGPTLVNAMPPGKAARHAASSVWMLRRARVSMSWRLRPGAAPPASGALPLLITSMPQIDIVCIPVVFRMRPWMT